MGAWQRRLEGLAVNVQFWNGRRVFVTGHTGFKGSWLSTWLQMMGAEVTGFALPPATDPSLFERASIGPGMTSIFGDVRSLDSLADALKLAEPEVVFHLAAQPLVRASYEDPVGTYSTNVMGTVNLLEAVRKTGTVKAVVNVTTDKCYENREWVWGYRETDPLGGYDPYSSSKACSELITAAYRSSFFGEATHRPRVALATARAGNVIGGGDWSPDRLVPDIVAALLDGREVSIRHPHAVRPWQHVVEPLRAYLMLAEHLVIHGNRFSEAWNFGPEETDSRPVSWIVERLISKWGRDTGWVHLSTDDLHEATQLKLDISRARTKLGWFPMIDLEMALGLIVEWVEKVQKTGDARRAMLDQLEWYQQYLSRQ